MPGINLQSRETEAHRFLDSLDVSAMKLGLGRVKALLETLGNPQDALPMVHIAGTNGKGSVTAMLSSVLTAAGLKTGRFISPHLLNVRERIAIDGQNISPEDFAQGVFDLKDHLEQLGWPREDWPTYFEFVNVLAYQYFRQKVVQITVFETGLGGRLDSTNVVLKPDLTVITGIALDHTKLLGNTLAEIAGEKAGIIKPNVPLVLGPALPSEAREVILRKARERVAPVVETQPTRLQPDTSEQSAKFGLRLYDHATGQTFQMSLMAPYQRHNAATVLSCVDVLQAGGFEIPFSAVSQGLRQTDWPARFQFLPAHNLLIDGSHNAEGFASLAEGLRTYFAPRRFVWLLSLRNNRPLAPLLELLQSFPTPLAVITTTGQPSHLYYPPDVLAPVVSTALNTHDNPVRAIPVESEPGPQKALARMQVLVSGHNHQSDEPALGIATGSLYTAGELLQALGLLQ